MLELRRAHMRWGPRKLKAYLERTQAEQNGRHERMHETMVSRSLKRRYGPCVTCKG